MNQDKDIECQMCQHAPWKEKLPGRLVTVTQAQGFSQRGDQPGPVWTCNTCTFINKLIDNECTMCNENRRSPNNREVVTDHPPPYDPLPTVDHAQSWCDLTIPGTMDRTTQTEGLDTGNPAGPTQKVINQLGRIYKLVRNRGGSQQSSRDASPLSHASNSGFTPEDSANACWPCSQCAFMNTMDKTNCDRCGYEDDVPVAVFPPPE